MFVNKQCLVLERWHHLGYMCPGVNKPVRLDTSSYVIEDKTEGWLQCRFMAPQTTLVRETGPQDSLDVENK